MASDLAHLLCNFTQRGWGTGAFANIPHRFQIILSFFRQMGYMHRNQSIQEALFPPLDTCITCAVMT